MIAVAKVRVSLQFKKCFHLFCKWLLRTDVLPGYIMERSEGESEMWVRVNLVPIKDTEYPVANLVGGREYRFR